MTAFSVDFLGCKISHTDAESVREALLAAGHTESDVANVRVVNTCCITGEAEKKSRQRVRKLLADADSNVRVFVTGCGASLRPGAYDDIDPRVTTLPGAAVLAAPAIVAAADQLAGLGCKGLAPGINPNGGPRAQRTRAFIKVQDGCSFTCSYCIVPTVRGTTRSRDLAAICADVARAVARGQREIVLTGVNIGLYRDERTRIGLPPLVKAIADVDGVERVRISSIEVNHVTTRLIAVMAEHPKVCPHLHVPLQSGSDAVLADMRRHYRTRRYRSAIAHARELIPHLNLTTDVIVGYPTEGPAEFAETLAFCNEMGFTKIHAFPFSPRPGTLAGPAAGTGPGTLAESNADPVHKSVKRSRSRALRTQADAHARALWNSKVGASDVVVVELAGTRSGMTLTAATQAVEPGDSHREVMPAGVGGYTADYCPVWFAGADASALGNAELVAVRIVGTSDRGLTVVPA